MKGTTEDRVKWLVTLQVPRDWRWELRRVAAERRTTMATLICAAIAEKYNLPLGGNGQEGGAGHDNNR
jgi:hypothetical protein